MRQAPRGFRLHSSYAGWLWAISLPICLAACAASRPVATANEQLDQAFVDQVIDCGYEFTVYLLNVEKAGDEDLRRRSDHLYSVAGYLRMIGEELSSRAYVDDRWSRARERHQQARDIISSESPEPIRTQRVLDQISTELARCDDLRKANASRFERIQAAHRLRTKGTSQRSDASAPAGVVPAAPTAAIAPSGNLPSREARSTPRDLDAADRLAKCAATFVTQVQIMEAMEIAAEKRERYAASSERVFAAATERSDKEHAMSRFIVHMKAYHALYEPVEKAAPSARAPAAADFLKALNADLDHCDVLERKFDSKEIPAPKK